MRILPSLPQFLPQQDSRARVWLSILIVAGAAIHFGTALLRLNTFWPFPRLVDFASFYAGAWAVRQHDTPYSLSPALRELLVEQAGLPFSPPLLNSFPIWPWLLQPLTQLDFPAAAWFWLVFNLVLLAWCTGELARIADIGNGAGRILLYALVITFGPVTLALTLGQTSILLLTLALWIGKQLSAETSSVSHWPGVVLWIPSIATKLFPLFWIGGLLSLRIWSVAAGALLGVLMFAGLHLLSLPRLTHVYLTDFLPAQASTFAGQGFLNDQSLLAWLLRLSQPMQFTVPGLSPSASHPVTWDPLWHVDATNVSILGVGLLGAGTVALSWYLWRQDRAHAEGLFFLWMTYGLLLFPHTERYNHTLLLPAIAWLWSRGKRGEGLAVIAYFLAGLSRLTHLWVQILPAPWAPLMTGTGIFAVVLLCIGIVVELHRTKRGGLDSAKVS